MAAKMPAKSILRQPSPKPKSTLSDEQKAQAERERRNLGIALHHASRIQSQKDIQAQILSDIERLIDFPHGSSFTPSEASNFVSLAQPFQPSDFDSLVEERRIDGKCGYALCSQAPRSGTMGSSAAWKLKGKGAEDYCSNDCLRKALYVKAQLSEVPAWEREPGQQPEIMLHQDDRPSVEREPPKVAVANDIHKHVANDLALERGETAASFRPGQVMTSAVVEKSSNSHKSIATGKPPALSHTAIEGYEPAHLSAQGVTRLESPVRFSDQGVDDLASQDIGEFENDAWHDLFDHVNKR